MEGDLTRFCELISERLHPEEEHIVGYLELNESTGIYSLQLPTFNNLVFPEREETATLNRHAVSVEGRTSHNMRNLPQSKVKAVTQINRHIYPVPEILYEQNCIPRGQNETTTKDTNFGQGDDTLSSFNLNCLSRSFKGRTSATSNAVSESSRILPNKRSLNSPSSQNEDLNQLNRHISPVPWVLYDQNCLLRSQNEIATKDTNSRFGDEIPIPCNLNYLPRGQNETTSIEISSSVDTESGIRNSLNALPKSEDDIASTQIRYTVDPETRISYNLNCPLVSQHETTSMQNNYPADIEGQILFNFHCLQSYGYESASRNNVHMHTEAQNILNFNLTQGPQNETFSTDNLSVSTGEEGLFYVSCISRSQDETASEAAAIPQNARFPMQLVCTRETEIYNGVMTYLRDTHGICFVYTNNFVDVLNDMKLLIRGCSYELQLFQPILPIFDYLQKVINSYLERVKNVGWDMFQEMIQTEKTLNSCLRQQCLLNKNCVVLSNSPVPININEDTMTSIVMLWYDLFSVNNAIQRNIERVNIYHKCKKEIVSILCQSRNICNHTNA